MRTFRRVCAIVMGKGIVEVLKYISFPPHVGDMTDEMLKYT